MKESIKQFNGMTRDELHQECQRLVRKLNYHMERAEGAIIRRDHWFKEREKELDVNERLESETRKLRLQYAGAMGLISEMSGHLALRQECDREPMIESITDAAADWCRITGWTARMVGTKLVLEPPQGDDNAE